jgi:beta-mannosidase
VISDKTQTTEGTLRVRVMTMDGKVMMEHKKQVTLSPLSSEVYDQFPFASLLKIQQDLRRLVVLTDFTVNGTIVSQNLNYLAPTKQVHLLPAKIDFALTQNGKAYNLKLSSDVVARDVYLTFGDLDVQVSDNFIDLIPGEPVNLTVKSSASFKDLKKSLAVTSLVDAFAPEGSASNDESPKTH